MIIKFLRKLFGSRNDRVIRRLSKVVKKINLLGLIILILIHIQKRVKLKKRIY